MKDRSEQVADEWLVLRSQDGDTHAFGLLIARWQGRLWRHACRLVRDRDAAWDVVQDAWISMIGGLARLDDPVAFPAWAYRIVTFKCADHVRRVERFRRSEAQVPIRTDDSNEDANDDLAALKEALSEMSVDQRAILSLHYLDELPLERIAGILDIPVGTVKSRLHHARSALRERMTRRTT